MQLLLQQSISSFWDYSLALKSDGTVIGWGDNNGGPTNVPVGLSNVVALASGVFHALAVKADGNVVGWGWNGAGQTNAPGELKNVISIAAGNAHSLAVIGTGAPWITVQPWSRTVLPGTSVQMTAMAAGSGQLSYHWYKNGSAIFVATNSSFIIPNSFLADAGSYSCVVSNSYGVATSAVATLNVATPLALAQTGSGTVTYSPTNYNIGDTVTLTAAPARWYAFSQWSDGNTQNPRSIIIGPTNNYTAIFTNTVPLEWLVKMLWDKSYGGTGDEKLTDIYIEQSGNVVLYGHSGSGISGNKTVPAYHGMDLWILQSDTNGTPMRQIVIGGNNNDHAAKMLSDGQGGYIIAGTSDSDVSWDKSQPQYGACDFWLIHINAQGTKTWDGTFGGSGWDSLSTICPTADGGWLLGGVSESGADGNKTAAPHGGKDYWIVKVDANGHKLWDRSYGGTGEDVLTCMKPAIDGGWLLAGYSASAISGNKTSQKYGGSDYWLVKVDEDGNKLWDHTYGGDSDDSLSCLEKTDDGGWLLAGWSAASGPSGNKTSVGFGYADYWLIKVDSNGNKLWEQCYGGVNHDWLCSVKKTADGGFLAFGISESAASGNKSSQSYGSNDYWVVKMNAYGSKQWETTLGGESYEGPPITAAEAVVENAWYIGGSSDSGASGNKTSGAWGNADWWLVKLLAVELPIGWPQIWVNGQLAAGAQTNFVIPATNTVQVVITSSFPNSTLFYCLDGADPLREVYAGPITLTNSAIIQSVAFNSDFSTNYVSDPVIVTLVPVYALTVGTNGNGTVAVADEHGPLNPQLSTFNLLSNTPVTLTATPAPGWGFAGWTVGNDELGMMNYELPLTVSSNTSVTAHFYEIPLYTVTDLTPGGGSVEFSPPPSTNNTYLSNTMVTVTATPSNGWTFLGWSGALSGNSPSNSYLLTSNSSIAALFGTTLLTTPVGNGVITRWPSNTYYPYGSMVRLSAVPNAGAYFNFWGIAAAGQVVSPLEFVFTNAAPSVNAIFGNLVAGEYALTVLINGEGTVVKTPQQTKYAAGANVTLTATPKPGWAFAGWSGDLGGSVNPVILSMNTNKTVTANFEVGVAPQIASITPINQTVMVGSNATITVTATGSAPLTYQWLKNNSVIFAETNSSFIIHNSSLGDAGSYSCLVSNSFGSATSAVARLNVTTNSFEAGLIAYYPFDGNANDASGNNRHGTLSGAAAAAGLFGQSLFFNDGPSVSLPIDINVSVMPRLTLSAWAYMTQRDGDNRTLFSHDNGQSDRALFYNHGSGGWTAFTGGPGYSSGGESPQGQWILVTATWDVGTVNIYQNGVWLGGNSLSAAGSGETSLTVGRSACCGDHFIGFIDDVRVYDRVLSSNEVQALYLNDTAGLRPQITSLTPTNQTVLVGSNATFAVTATGTPPLSYQWLKNGSAILGGTNSSFSLLTSSFSDSGNYVCVISNAFGVATSAVATLTVTTNSYEIGLVAFYPFDGNANDAVGANHPMADGIHGTPAWVADRTGNANSALAISDGAWIDYGDNPALGFGASSFSVSFWMNAGEQSSYILGKTERPSDQGWSFQCEAFDGPGVRLNLGDGARWTGNSLATGLEAFGAWRHVCGVVDRSAGTAVIFLNGIPKATLDISAFGSIANATSFAIGHRVDNWSDYNGQLDELRIYGRALSAGEVQALYAKDTEGLRPQIAQITPTNQTVMVGSNATITVTATGSTPLAYQWLKNGSAILNATNSQLSILNSQLGDSGSYQCLVSNSFGSVTSAVAILSVSAAPEFAWIAHGGLNGSDYAYAVTVDVLGNTTMAGEFNYSTTFGGTLLTNAGGKDILLARFDAAGALLWARRAGGPGLDAGNAVACDSAGNLYVAGYFNATASFGPTNLTTYGGKDAFLAKYDAAGSLVWVRQAGSVNGDEAKGVAVDPQGNVWVTGYFSDTNNFGSTNVPAIGFQDVFLAKYSADGALLWARRDGSALADEGLAIATDAAGNAFVAGYVTDNPTFGTNSFVRGGTTDFFLAKYDPQGNNLWVRHSTVCNNMYAEAVAVDRAGNAVVGGFFYSATLGTNVFAGSGLKDIFLAKYDSAGQLLWARQAAGTNYEEGLALATGPVSEIYLAGYFRDTLGIGPFSLPSAGSEDILLARYDATGDLLWTQRAGGTSSDYGRGLAVDLGGNAYLAGSFSGTAAFGGTNVASGGSVDAFVAKIGNAAIPASAPAGMALIPAGEFTMGDTFTEGDADERPTHTVNVSAFYMDQYLVTYQLWTNVYAWAMANGYTFDRAGSGKAANHPVHTVSWYDMVKWCNARSEKEGLVPAYYTDAGLASLYKTGQVNVATNWVNWAANGYRLPTEAEWEKAARGGLSSKRFPWGDTVSHSQANYNASASLGYDLSYPAGYHPNYAAGGMPYTSPAGTFAANGYGLYDMTGNIWEWCWDYYSNGYYSSSPTTDPQGPGSSSTRVLRGGSWNVAASNSRCAVRLNYAPSVTNYYIGFRCVRAAGGAQDVAPQITQQPQSQAVLLGSNATFTVTATGTPPLYYQWLKNNSVIFAETNSSFIITNSSLADAGNYQCVVSNAYGSVTSAVATLTVVTPPSIATSPQSQSVVAGTNVAFTVTATGTAPLAYQWRFNGTNIQGATSPSFAINNVQLTHAGNYSVVVANAYGAATSAVATLTVLIPNQPPIVAISSPANGQNFFNAPVNYTVSVTASDSDGSLTAVRLFQVNPANGQRTLLGSGGASPLNVAQTNVQAGEYLYLAEAVDNQGLTNSTLPVAVTVNSFAYSKVINFDHPMLDTAGSERLGSVVVNYFKSNDVTVAELTPGTLFAVARGSNHFNGAKVAAVSMPNFLRQYNLVNPEEKPPVWYRLDFNLTAESLSFQRIRLLQDAGGVVHPRWIARALNDVGEEIASVGEEAIQTLVEVPARKFTLQGPGIASLVVESYPEIGTYFDSMLLDDLVLNISSNANQLPSVTIVNPTNGMAFVAPANVGVNIQAQDRDGAITNVALILNDLLVAETNAQSASVNLFFALSGLAPGNYVLFADATDNRGATRRSRAVIKAVNHAPPANDNFAARETMEGLETDVLGRNEGATREADEPFHASNGGGRSVWWQWTAPVNGLAVLTTAGSTFDTLLAVYTGTNLATLTSVAANDDASAGVKYSRVAFNAVAGTTYQFAVDGYNGAMGEVSLFLVLNQLPTVMLTAPTNGTVFTAPVNVTLAANAVDPDGTVAKVEFFAGALKLGEDTISPFALTLTNVGAGSYTYTARATDTLGASAVSSPVTVTVNPPRPANDDFAQAQVLSGLAASATCVSISATREAGEPNHLGNQVGRSVWYRWTATNTGRATLTTAGSTFDTLLVVYTGSALGGLTPIASNDDASPGERTSRVSFDAAAGVTYQIVVEGFNNAAGTVLLALEFNYPPLVAITSPANNAEFTEPVDVTFTVAASDPDTNGAVARVELYQGGVLLGTLFNGEPPVTQFEFTLTNMPPGSNYQFVARAVDNAGISATSAPVRVVVNGAPKPPQITAEPQDLVVARNSEATFAVGVNGTPPFAFQWLFNGNPVAGGTNATLVLPYAQPRSAGGYQVVVSNSVGSATSRVASLAVIIAPSVTITPLSTNVPPGGSVFFNATVGLGTPPFGFQWYFNGVALPNATNAAYTILSAAPADSGTYYVVVTNLAGQAISLAAQLRVSVLYAAPDGRARDDFWVTDGPVYASVFNPLEDLVYLGGKFNHVGPNVGHGAALDLNTGAADLAWPKVAGPVYAVVADGAGGWFIGGAFTSVGGLPRTNLAHILGNRTVDTNWAAHAGGVLTPSVQALALLGGTLYAGGLFKTINGLARENLAALSAANGQPTAWAPNPSGEIRALAVSGNSLFVGGSFTVIGGNRENLRNLAQVSLADGNANPNWYPDPSSPVFAMAISGNRLFVGGQFESIDYTTRSKAAAFELDTLLLSPDWSPVVYGGDVLALATANGTVYLGGRFTSVNYTPGFRYAAAVNANNGVLIAGWQPQFNGAVLALAADTDAVYAGGEFTLLTGQSRNYLAKLRASDAEPLPWNPGADKKAYALALGDNALYAGGEFRIIGGVARANAAALRLSTGEAADWNPGANGAVRALALSGTNVFLGGEFSQVNGLDRAFLAAVNATNGVATAWNPGANSNVLALVVEDKAVYAGGLFTRMGGAAISYLGAVDEETGILRAWDPQPDGPVRTLAAYKSRIYAGGQFRNVGGRSFVNLVGLNPAGQPEGWSAQPDPNGPVHALAVVDNNAVYAGGLFNYIGGKNRSRLAMLEQSGSASSSFNPIVDTNGVTPINALAIVGNNLYLGGFFNRLGEGVGAVVRHHAAALPLDANEPASWNPDFDKAVNVIAGSSNMVAVGGDFLKAGGELHPFFAVFSPVGAPVILSSPRRQEVVAGTNVSFEVVARGAEPLQYQWRLNGVPIPPTMNPTATNRVLVLNNAQAANAGSYSVSVANAFDVKDSRAAVLVVGGNRVTLANQFAAKGALTGQAGNVIGDSFNATAEPGEPYHGDARPQRSVWISWIAPATGVATFDTRGSSFDTTLAVYTGELLNALTNKVSDEDSGGFLTSLVQFNAVQGVVYHLAVDGVGGASGVILLNWSMDTSGALLPEIIEAPFSQSVDQNADVTLAVTAIPAGATYQWYYQSNAVADATNAALVIQNFKPKDVGSYFVRVSANSRHVDSKPVVVEIGKKPEAYTHDKLASAVDSGSAQAMALAGRPGNRRAGFFDIQPGIPGTQILNNFGSTTEMGEPNIAGVLGGASRWFNIVPQSNGLMVIDTLGSTIDTVMAVYTGDQYSSLRLQASDDNSAPDGIRSQVKLNVTAGETYLVAVDGVGGAQGNISLNWKYVDPPLIVAHPADQSVQQGGVVNLTVLVSGTGPFEYQWVLNDTNLLAGATNATLVLANVQPEQAGRYKVRVRNAADIAVSQDAALTVEAPLRFDTASKPQAGENSFKLKISGKPGQGYIIQGTTDFVNWIPLVTNWAQNGYFEFSDPSLPANSRRFYRAVPADE